MTRASCASRCGAGLLGLLLSLALAGVVAAEPPAAPVNYRLQPGDEVAITVQPRTEYSVSAAIPPDGLLQLRDVGSIKAAGLTLDELTETARQALGKVLRRPRVSAALSRLGQSIQGPRVTVVGAVDKPGPLNLEDGLRLRKALELCGGTTKDADLTQVAIVRKDLSRIVVDLSGEVRVSDPAQNPLLREGDSVMVPARLKIRVTVSGGVGKPGGLEEVEAGVRVSKALEMAGGPAKDADLSQVRITHSDLSQTVVDLSQSEHLADPAHNRLLQDGDSIEVPLLYRPGSVSISGEVVKAGSFELMPAMTLENLIVAAGGLNLVADYEHVDLQRMGRARQVINLVERRQQGAKGQVLLEPGDAVRVPRMQDTVILVGAIPTPGPRALKPGQTVKDFFLSGSPETLAALNGNQVDLPRAQLIRSGQPGKKLNLRQILSRGKPEENVTLETGDVIFLPPRGEPRATVLDYIRTIPFIGSLFGLF